ncbi:MAG: class I SAM-dependent methyltransferase [Gammaproteobacteria bacterium]
MALQAELEYQAARAGKIGRAHATPDYIIERYRRTTMWRLLPKEFMFRKLADEGAFEGKRVLDFGSGEGTVATQLARLGAQVTGVDISPELVALAREQARLDGVSDKVDFIVADITRNTLPRDHFDFVVCEAVLHHVDVYRFVPALVAALKPGGMMLVQEPRALPPLLQRLRDITPIAKDASPDERPLNEDEFRCVSSALNDVEVEHFHIAARLTRLLPNLNRIDQGHPFTKAAVAALTGIDRALMTAFPALRGIAGIAVLYGRKPFPVAQAMAMDEETTQPAVRSAA